MKPPTIGGRVPQDLNDEVKRVSRSWAIPLTEIFEKALRFFVDHPERVLHYQNRFLDNPRQYLSMIEKVGIMNREELVFILTLACKAYEQNQDSSVLSKWVKGLVLAIQELLPLCDKDREIMTFLSFNFPGEEAFVGRVANSIKTLEQEPLIKGKYALMVANCLLVAIKDERLSLSDAVFHKIKTLIEPFCFYVARRAIAEGPRPLLLNSSLLDRQAKKDEYHHFNSENTEDQTIFLDVFLSTAHSVFNSPGRTGYFAFAFYIKSSKNIITFDASSLEDLYRCIKESETTVSLSKIDPNNPDKVSSGTFSSGVVSLHLNAESKEIEKGGVKILLTDEEYNELLAKTKWLCSREDVLADISKEYAKKYGAI